MKVALIGTQAASLLGFRRELILKLVAEGHQVYAFATDFTADNRRAVARMGAIPQSYALSRAGLNPLQDLRDMMRLTHQLSDIAPDRVLTYFAKPVIFASLAAYRAGVPVIVAMLEGLGFAFTKQPHSPSIKARLLKRVQLMLYRWILPKVSRVIFLNPDDAEELIIQHGVKIQAHHVLGGIGLDLQHYAFTPAVTSPVRFVFVGRLLREKGIWEFIQAAQQVRKRYPDAEFQVVGDADSVNPGSLTRQELLQLRQQSHVSLVGYTDDIRPFLASASVFVLPSYREGLPRSTQEAMAMGRAVITTDVPGCRQTVRHGENGFITPPWDADALAERMIWFLEHNDQIAVMGRVSHKMAQENYDATSVNQTIMHLLEL